MKCFPIAEPIGFITVTEQAYWFHLGSKNLAWFGELNVEFRIQFPHPACILEQRWLQGE